MSLLSPPLSISPLHFPSISSASPSLLNEADPSYTQSNSESAVDLAKNMMDNCVAPNTKKLYKQKLRFFRKWLIQNGHPIPEGTCHCPSVTCIYFRNNVYLCVCVREEEGLVPLPLPSELVTQFFGYLTAPAQRLSQKRKDCNQSVTVRESKTADSCSKRQRIESDGGARSLSCIT
jgi:hypothetical protein